MKYSKQTTNEIDTGKYFQSDATLIDCRNLLGMVTFPFHIFSPQKCGILQSVSSYRRLSEEYHYVN